MFNIKHKWFRLIVAVGFSFLLVGISLYLYTSFKVNELQQILDNNNLTSEEYWNYQGSFDWWQNSSETIFFPLILVLIVFGAILVFSVLLMNLRHSNLNFGTVIQKSFSKKAVSENETLDSTIMRTIIDKKPETIKTLVNLVHEKNNLPRETILDQIILLKQAKKINLNTVSGSAESSDSMLGKTKWYWFTIAVSCVSILLVLEVPENVYPLVYGRYLFGSFFVLLLPGYSLIRALYVGKEIDNIERFGLSIALSIGLVGIVSFFFNFSPWKITFFPVVLCLSILVILFATVGFVKQFWANNE